MTGSGPVVPTPPAEVPTELTRGLAQAVHDVKCAGLSPHYDAWEEAYARALAGQVAPLVERMVAERVQAEVLRYQFAPMGDNHHNAFMCPYCSPQLQAERDAAAERVRAARDEALREAERQVLTFAAQPDHSAWERGWAAGVTAAAQVVAELREATP